jgi:hypothetical protein
MVRITGRNTQKPIIFMLPCVLHKRTPNRGAFALAERCERCETAIFTVKMGCEKFRFAEFVLIQICPKQGALNKTGFYSPQLDTLHIPTLYLLSFTNTGNFFTNATFCV